MPLANWLRHLCCPARDNDIPNVKEFAPSRALAVDLACSHICQLQCPVRAEESWLSQIGMCLSVCKLALHAVDVRFILFGGESFSAWVLTEAGGQVRADGWGRLTVVANLAEQADSVAIIRDHRMQQQQQQQQLMPQTQSLQQQVLLLMGATAAKVPGSGVASGGAAEVSALVCHQVSEAVQLSHRDLLLLPVRQGRRLTAALLLGFNPDGGPFALHTGGGAKPPGPGAAAAAASATATVPLGGAAGGDSSCAASAGELRLEPSDLEGLTRLASVLAFGILGSEPSHMRFLSTAADHLGTLPLRQSLSGLLAGLLHALRELLAIRFTIQLQPVLALTQGLTGGRAILFTQRNTVASGGAAAARDVLLETHASVQSLSAQAAIASSTGQRAVPPHRMMSWLSGPDERVGVVTGGSATEASPVRAVRISLANTLLSEALRSRGDSTGQGADPGIPRGSQRDRVSGDQAGATLAGAAQDTPPTKRQQQQRFNTMILRDASGFVLDEQQPCRDILTLGRLGGSVGSLVLSLESRPTTASAASAASAAITAPPTSLEMNGTDSQLYGGPVFGLYLISADTLPSSVLQAIANESKLLLGLLLDAVRSAVAAGGQAAAELRALQLQLVDPQSIAPGGALTVPPTPLQDRSKGPGPAAGPGCREQGAPGVGLGKHIQRLISGARGTKHPIRGFDGTSSGGVPVRVGSASISAAVRTRLVMADTHAGRALLHSEVAAGLDLLDRTMRSSQDGAVQQWMLASSPELALEAAPGPSHLELLVSTMRSHLGSAIAEAEATSEAKSTLAQDMAALDLQELIGRGGQGVVYRGLLHGLETAIKIQVCRDGEPLEEDELHAAAAKVGAMYDSDGMISAAEWEENGARLRKAKRGAMEHALMPTLSHPNIVQAYATFSNVVTVRCTYRGERQPRLQLCSRESPILANMPNNGPLNQVICFEYCDCGTLLEAAHRGAFRPPGVSAFTAIVRPALVPLYKSLLEVALALRYLHARRLAHCDVKPANVLLKGSNRDVRGWTCKLSDFGCSRLMTELPCPEGAGEQATSQSQSQSQLPGLQQAVLGFRMVAPLGTVSYMAPEVFLKDKVLTAAVDIYAFGIMMYELLTCRAPYVDVPAADVPRSVVRGHLRPEFHPLVPPEYCAVAVHCWATSPSRRPTASQLVGEIEQLLKAAMKAEERMRQHANLDIRQGARSGRDPVAAAAAAATTAATTAEVRHGAGPAPPSAALLVEPDVPPAFLEQRPQSP